MNSQILCPITEDSQVSEARRMATNLAQQIGFSENETGKVAVVVTELATNLVKHAQSGRLLIRVLRDGAGIEVLSLDRGPGIANVSQCLQDGYSTGGSAGTGLGALTRLSTECDIHSVPGKGTSVWARLKATNAEQSRKTTCMKTAALCVAKPGEEVCGDGWGVEFLADRSICVVADGLGHGADAARASELALKYVHENAMRSPKEMIEVAHDGLRSTRGAALAIAEVNYDVKTVRFAGIGNIAAAILIGETSRHLISQTGIVGHEMHRVTEFSYPWPEDALLILHSDGLATRWDLKAYPGLIARHPTLIAGVLYRDFTRGHDDVTVLVAKEQS